MPTSPQVETVRYVNQFNAFMEHQRQIFDEERALWNTERMGLYERIAQLEASLRRYQSIPSSQVSSPIKDGTGASQNNRSLWDLPSKDGSSHIGSTATGHEIWRGPKPDVQPTRTFSDPTAHLLKPGDRSHLPSIAEDATCGRKDTQQNLRQPNMSSPKTDKNFDGINFKAATVPAKKVMTPLSLSPLTSSPSRLSPGAIELPFSRLEAPLDPYTKDAGHTPLARRTHFDADGASSADNGATPTLPEIDRPPLEPYASFVKMPSERSESYFPVVEDQSVLGKENPQDQKDEFQDGKDESRDEDPELKGPLGLDNTKDGDERFLQELNSKLLQAAKSGAFDPPDADTDTRQSPAKKKEEEGEEFEQPEHEPKLRIKRSMNFGSAFGAKTLGKGI